MIWENSYLLKMRTYFWNRLRFQDQLSYGIYYDKMTSLLRIPFYLLFASKHLCLQVKTTSNSLKCFTSFHSRIRRSRRRRICSQTLALIARGCFRVYVVLHQSGSCSMLQKHDEKNAVLRGSVNKMSFISNLDLSRGKIVLLSYYS